MADLLSYYKDRQVLVTGCSSGIGGATARKLQGAGARVIGVDRRPPPEGLAQFIETDLNDADSIHETVGALNSPIWACIRFVPGCRGCCGPIDRPAGQLPGIA